jgi:hypothetical protein
MGLFTRWHLRKAARRYATGLGPALAAAYGGSEHYTADQIRLTVDRVALDTRFIAFGYAAFLPREQFDALQPHMPIQLSYDEALSLLERYRPSQPLSASGDAAVSDYVTSSVGSTCSGGGAPD